MKSPKFTSLLAARGQDKSDWLYALDDTGRVWSMVMFNDGNGLLNMKWRLLPTTFVDFNTGEELILKAQNAMPRRG